MYETKTCPIEHTFQHIGKKWAVHIIRDIILGKNRFTEFLESNPEMSAKMLSKRLKELESSGLIEKVIISKNPVQVRYKLTKKGNDLKNVLFELAVFSMKNFSKNVLVNPPEKYEDKIGKMTAKKKLGMIDEK